MVDVITMAVELRELHKRVALAHAGTQKLRGALVEGLIDALTVPDVSSDNTRAAHELMSCPFFTGALNVMQMSARMGPELAGAVHIVVIEALTSAAVQCLDGDFTALREAYGYEHITGED